MNSPERSVGLESAYTIANDFFTLLKEKHGITYSLVNHCSADDPYPTFSAYAFDSNNKLIICGNGKGVGNESKVGALFELIEHLYDSPFFMKNVQNWDGVREIRTKDIITSMRDCFAGTPLFENLQLSTLASSYPCKTLRCDSSDIHMPLAFLGPHYPFYFPYLNQIEDSNFLQTTVYGKDDVRNRTFYFPGDFFDRYDGLVNAMKYTSTNGGSAGLDRKDVLLHAMNEVIERDVTSQFLINGIYKENMQDYYILKHESLSEENQKITKFIEKKYNVKLFVCDITGSPNIPTILVLASEKKYYSHSPVFGVGTSLCYDYAVKRALLEYKQSIDIIINDTVLPIDDDFYDSIVENNEVPVFFKKIFYFNCELFHRAKMIEQQLLPHASPEIGILSAEVMFSYVKNQLTKKKYSIIYNECSTKVGAHVVSRIKVIVPEMSNISLPGTLRFPSKQTLKAANIKVF